MEDCKSVSGLTEDARSRAIVKTSVVGILTNVLLAAFKAIIGLGSHSIAVTLDAVNNLSDALSSIVTIVGTKLASKNPDKEHPLGHGRIEYLSAMIVTGIVLYAGVASVVKSVEKIVYPEEPSYNFVALAIIALAVVVKLVLGRYVKAQGKRVNSVALAASGSDATFDALLSLSVLLSAIFFTLTGVSLEAYVGILISGFIIKAGVEMMNETLNEILGARADKETVDRVKRILAEEPATRGAFDLFMYNYGPDKYYASVHLELPDTMTVREVDQLSRSMETKVYKETGVILTGIGVYAYNTENEEAVRIQNDVRERTLAHDWAVQFHGFYIDVEKKDMRFDVVMSFDVKPSDGGRIIHDEILKEYPDYTIQITPDVDISVSD